ncbi:FadR family transcriptional regulator [Arcanobacterium haemolyticum]|nr:FadR family transcriptional regulator [Arcanobacterium haemolyticum]
MARSSHSEILNDLGRQLEANNIKPGDTLTVADLEERYAASRTLIREALRVLESIGMITSRRRVGITVTDRENWNTLDSNLIHWRLEGPNRHRALEELTELRFAVEPVAAGVAATRAEESDIRQLLSLGNMLLELGEQGKGASEDYLNADIQYHRLLLTASRNAIFLPLADPICETLKIRAQHGLTPASPDPESLFGHIATARAIADRDSSRAEQFSRLYMAQIQREISES